MRPGLRLEPAAEVVRGDVADLDGLDGLDVDAVNVILGGLPVPSLPRPVNAAVFAWVERVAPDAPYSQLTEMALVYKRLYARLFEDVRFRFVARNLPPAGVYHCRGLRENWRDHVPGRDV